MAISKSEYAKQWRLKNPDKIARYQKKYYSKNKEKLLKNSKIWRLNNIEIGKLRASNYQKDNREKFNIYKKKLWAQSSDTRKKQNCRHLTILALKRHGYISGNRLCQAENCNNIGVIHHWDYDNYLDISFVCSEHHAKIHSGIIPNGIFRHF